MATSNSDIITISALLAGHREPVEAFVRDNTSWMYGLARQYVRDDALAEDCVQDSFASLFKALPKFERRSRLRSWLHRIVVNTALMKMRTARRRREEPLEPFLATFDCDNARVVGDFATDMTQDEALERAEAAAMLRAAVARLLETYRCVVELQLIKGYDTRATADALGLTETNVKVRLHRARIALRQAIDHN